MPSCRPARPQSDRPSVSRGSAANRSTGREARAVFSHGQRRRHRRARRSAGARTRDPSARTAAISTLVVAGTADVIQLAADRRVGANRPAPSKTVSSAVDGKRKLSAAQPGAPRGKTRHPSFTVHRATRPPWMRSRVAATVDPFAAAGVHLVRHRRRTDCWREALRWRARGRPSIRRVCQ